MWTILCLLDVALLMWLHRRRCCFSCPFFQLICIFKLLFSFCFLDFTLASAFLALHFPGSLHIYLAVPNLCESAKHLLLLLFLIPGSPKAPYLDPYSFLFISLLSAQFSQHSASNISSMQTTLNCTSLSPL
jgi:hypothetical protein